MCLFSSRKWRSGKENGNHYIIQDYVGARIGPTIRKQTVAVWCAFRRRLSGRHGPFLPCLRRLKPIPNPLTIFNHPRMGPKSQAPKATEPWIPTPRPFFQNSASSPESLTLRTFVQVQEPVPEAGGFPFLGLG